MSDVTVGKLKKKFAQLTSGAQFPMKTQNTTL